MYSRLPKILNLSRYSGGGGVVRYIGSSALAPILDRALPIKMSQVKIAIKKQTKVLILNTLNSVVFQKNLRHQSVKP